MGTPAPERRTAHLRTLLTLGFGGILALWVLWAFVLVARMTNADDRSLAIRSRFLRNDQALSNIRTQTLLSSVYLRDALLETSPGRTAEYRDQLLRLRDAVATSTSSYVPHSASELERGQWDRLRVELDDYWRSALPILESNELPDRVSAMTSLRDRVITRREAVIRISDRIEALNQEAFSTELEELARIRQALRASVWQISLAAVAIGAVIAFVASRRAQALETRLQDQRRREAAYSDQLQRLSAQLLRAQEDERRRIARELHDEVGQALSALKLELAVVERTVGTPQCADALAEARAIADTTLRTTRDLSQLLHPSMLDDLGLVDTATWYVRAFSRRTGIPAELSIDSLDNRLAPDVETCTYRVLQEAMTNIARHANATRCRVHLTCGDRALRIVVEDDGRGLAAGAGRPDERGLGLISVRERVAGLGGTLNLSEPPAGGTVLTVELPLAEAS